MTIVPGANSPFVDAEVVTIGRHLVPAFRRRSAGQLEQVMTDAHLSPDATPRTIHAVISDAVEMAIHALD